jgi:hypothetical protein
LGFFRRNNSALLSHICTSFSIATPYGAVLVCH